MHSHLNPVPLRGGREQRRRPSPSPAPTSRALLSGTGGPITLAPRCKQRDAGGNPRGQRGCESKRPTWAPSFLPLSGVQAGDRALQASVTPAALGWELWKRNHVPAGPPSTEESAERRQRAGRPSGQAWPGLPRCSLLTSQGRFCMGPVCFELGEEVMEIQRSGPAPQGGGVLPAQKPSCPPP